MKQLTCEMCGSTDLIKQDGVFVCQTCGTKYSVEEAKKMMVEGTVKVDNSEKIAKYYQLARTAKNEDDSETAAKYYGLVREEKPEDWEAKFYSVYYEAMECKVKDAFSMCKKLEKIAPSILSAIKNIDSKDKQIEYTLEVASKMNEIALMFLNGNSEEATEEVPNLLIIWADQLEEKYPNVVEITDQSVTFWENALTVLVDTYGTGEKEIDDTVEKCTKKIRKYKSSYVAPKSNISVHTAASPNKATVEILKIGHTDFTTLPLVPIPVQYIAAGPDSAGGISVELRLKNIKGKTIKYATLYVTAFDQVGSPAACTVHQEATRALSVTGPIEAGKDSGKLIFETIWYNPTITSVRMHSMIVEYSDGTKEKYKPEEYTLGANTISNAKQGEQIAKLTVTRNETKTTLIGYNLTCILDSKETFQLGYMETVTIPVTYGRHKIDFEFKGQSLVPAKCKSTPEFIVDGDTAIELKRDVMWGGFKTRIIK